MNYDTTITLDLSGEQRSAPVTAKQGDRDTRYIFAQLLAHGQPYTIPTGVTARVAMTKPRGQCVLNDAEIIGTNTVKITLTEQMLIDAGDARAEVMLYSGNTMLSSAVFDLVIQPSAYNRDAVESSPEYQTFVDALGEIEIATDAAETATSNAVTQANYAKSQGDYAKTQGDAAKTQAGAAQTAASSANTAASSARTAASSANTATTNANNAASRANAEADRCEELDVTTLDNKIDAHIANKSNPHDVTPDLIGAAPYQVIQSGDFNDVITPGIYTMRSATANKPSGESYYSLIVGKSDTGNYVQQLAIMEGTARMFVRYLGSTTWGAWKELSTTDHTHTLSSIGAAPISHAVEDTTYGASTSSLRGHMMFAGNGGSSSRAISLSTSSTTLTTLDTTTYLYTGIWYVSVNSSTTGATGISGLTTTAVKATLITLPPNNITGIASSGYGVEQILSIPKLQKTYHRYCRVESTEYSTWTQILDSNTLPATGGLKTLNATYDYLPSTPFWVAGMSTHDFLAAMPLHSRITVIGNPEGNFSDAPCQYCQYEFIKGSANYKAAWAHMISNAPATSLYHYCCNSESSGTWGKVSVSPI